VDRISSDGILAVYLKEDYSNTWTPAEPEPDIPEDNPEEPEVIPEIVGPDTVYPYDIVNYTAENASGGEWILTKKCGKVTKYSDRDVEIEITTGRSGEFDLIYRFGGTELTKHITILSI
jgi:hypothetical protein